MSLQKAGGEAFPLLVKCGHASHVFESQVYARVKLQQCEETAVYTIAADTTKAIIDERAKRGGTMAIGRFTFPFSDELACGIKKLMKP